MKPRARSADIEQQWVDDELVVYDVKSGRAHCLHPMVASVWSLADGSRLVAEILDDLRNADATVADVWAALDVLGDADLLEERIAPPAGERRWSRRDLIREVAGAAGALGIASLAVPLPGAAQSGAQGGDGGSSELSQKEIDEKASQEQRSKQGSEGSEQSGKESSSKESTNKESTDKESSNKEASSKESSAKGGVDEEQRSKESSKGSEQISKEGSGPKEF